ncbi:MAG: hypothetical protein U5L05_04615 [Rubrivivax sp.]|nr:hypothetical protein [Rubrivivax sp.]
MAFGSNLTAPGDTMPWVSEPLMNVSGGSVNLQVFEPGRLVPALGIFDAVASGKVETGCSLMGYELCKVPASVIFGALPIGMESPQFGAWMCVGGGDKLLKEAFKPHNVYPTFCGSISPEAAGCSPCWRSRHAVPRGEQVGRRLRAAGAAAAAHPLQSQGGLRSRRCVQSRPARGRPVKTASCKPT